MGANTAAMERDMPLLTPKNRRGRRYWINLLFFALILLFVVAPLAYFQTLTWFYIRPASHPVCCLTPADWGAEYEEVRLRMPDGT